MAPGSRDHQTIRGCSQKPKGEQIAAADRLQHHCFTPTTLQSRRRLGSAFCQKKLFMAKPLNLNLPPRTREGAIWSPKIELAKNPFTGMFPS